MLKSFPQHNSTNFKGNEVTLFFNEQIESKGLINELIITPDDNVQFKEIPRKKSITIRFKDTLRQNTTYNLNFGNSIVDITERNPSTNAVLAFSTGLDIDTAFIKGKAIDMFTQKPLTDVVAVIQPLNDTIDIQKHKPAYLSRVDEEGNFIINNLPQQEFRLYAIKDDNGNLVYNVGKEMIALYPNNVNPSYVDTVYNLYLSPQNTNLLRLISQRHQYNYSSLIFNKGLLKYSIDMDTLFTYTSNNARNLNIFHPFNFQDSIPIKYHAIDSNEFTFDSIFYLKKNFESDTLDPEFSVIINPENGDVIRIPDTINIDFNLRIKSFKIDTVLFVLNGKDSIITTSFDFGLISDKRLFVKNLYTKAKTIEIKMLNGLIISNQNDTIRNIKLNYSIPNEEKYGQIDGEVISPFENLILQLITPKGATKEELFINPGKFSFKYISPGTYKLRLIHDANNNHIWNPGNHYKNIQPEKVVINDEDILIKANWIVQDKILTIK